MKPDKKTLEKIWAEVPPDYYFSLNFLQRLWHSQKWHVIRTLLLEKEKPRTILEVGCNAGHLTHELSKLFPKAKIIGIDIYFPAIKEAKKRYPHIQFLVADAHKLPFKTNSFDSIVTSETIEHVLSPETMLREIRRVMKHDGTAIIEMDSGSRLFRIVWFLWVRWGRGKVWKNAHLHPFTESELEKLIRTNGFIIKKKVASHVGMAISFLVAKTN